MFEQEQITTIKVHYDLLHTFYTVNVLIQGSYHESNNLLIECFIFCFVCLFNKRLWVKFLLKLLTATNLLSEWLLFNGKMSNFSSFSWREQVTLRIMMTTLYQTITLSWSLIVLTHWNNSPRENTTPHSDTFPWFWANQSLLFLLNVPCLAEKQQILILYSLVWPNRSSNPRSTALEAGTLMYFTTDVVLLLLNAAC